MQDIEQDIREDGRGGHSLFLNGVCYGTFPHIGFAEQAVESLTRHGDGTPRVINLEALEPERPSEDYDFGDAPLTIVETIHPQNPYVDGRRYHWLYYRGEAVDALERHVDGRRTQHGVLVTHATDIERYLDHFIGRLNDALEEAGHPPVALPS